MNQDNQPPPLTKRQRWERKQQEKHTRRNAQEQRQAGKKILPWIIGIAVIAGLGWWIARNANNPAVSPLPSDLTVTADDWFRGPANAPVTLVEYADFQCPACGAYAPVVKQLETAFPTQLRVVMRHYPLTQIHKNAMAAARTAEAAGRQGKFWEMHDQLYAAQGEWSNLGNPDATFQGYAERLDLDTTQFVAAYNDPAAREKINRQRASGDRVGVRGTPSFFLNGQKISNPGSLDEFKQLVEAAIAAAPLPTPSPDEKYHAHADLAVYVNGKALDFSAAKFQSTKDKELSAEVHLHAGKGTVVHLHERGVTLAQFFQSLGMAFTDTCISLENGKAQKFCADNAKTLKLYVNGKINSGSIANYQPHDLDRMLISYGSESEAQLKVQLDAVSDEACIYSETCPERGKPPEEECVGGLGTGCE